MIGSVLKGYGWQAAAMVAGMLLAAQTWRLHSEQLAHRDLIATTAKADTARADAALKRAGLVNSAERAHAQQTQENSDAFTKGQPARDAVARADLDRVERLLLGAEQRAATYAAMSQANAEACRGAADRLAALDGQLVAGVGVVAALRRDLGRRDAEVVLLSGQLAADRELAATP